MSYTSRLNAAQLNNLIISYIEGGLNYTVDGSIKVNNAKNILEIVTEYKKISKDETATYLFQAVSDAQKMQQRKNLAYINDVIEQFEQKNPGDCKMLLPLMQSRLWKKHCVLVEVTIKKGEKKIKIHDAQSWWRNIFYPNCLTKLKGCQVEYTSYAKQKDNYSCVYFVYQFIKKILGNNLKEPIEQLFRKSQFDSLNTLDEKHPDPIGKLIHNNFNKSCFNIREIESGETIPWEKEAFKKYLNKEHFQGLNNEIIVFGDKHTLSSAEDSMNLKLSENSTISKQIFQQTVSSTSASSDTQNLTRRF